MSRFKLRRNSNDRIVVFDRDEWLLKRQRERRNKLLNIDNEECRPNDKLAVSKKMELSDITNHKSVGELSPSFPTYSTKSTTNKGVSFDVVHSKREPNQRNSKDIEQQQREAYKLKCSEKTDIDFIASTNSTYGSRVKNSFDGILNYVKTSSNHYSEPNSTAMQSIVSGQEKRIKDSQYNLATQNGHSKNSCDEKTETIKNDTKIDCVKMRKKLLPRSASSAADSNSSMSKVRWQENNNTINTGKAMQESTMQIVNEARHIPMKLRRKSEIFDYNGTTKWMERPKDVEAPETDVLLLKRWIDVTKSWSVEENPLKNFKLKDDDLDDMNGDITALKTIGGKLMSAPITISPAIDPYQHLGIELSSYEGERDGEGRPHGSNVIITFENGDIFRGDMQNGQRHGYGILKFVTKRQYSRFVQNGSMVIFYMKNNKIRK